MLGAKLLRLKHQLFSCCVGRLVTIFVLCCIIIPSFIIHQETWLLDNSKATSSEPLPPEQLYATNKTETTDDIIPADQLHESKEANASELTGSVEMDPLTEDLENNRSSIMAETQRRLEIRKKRFQDKCREGKKFCSLTGGYKHHQYFFFKYNSSICIIPKAGSSTWRIHLRRVNEGPPLNVPIYEDERKERFINRPENDVYKEMLAMNNIITVRHPLTRLVSAFRDKYRDGLPMEPNQAEKEEHLREEKAGSFWEERFYQFWLPALFANSKVPYKTYQKVGLSKPINQKTRYNISVYEKLYDVLKPQIDFTQYLKFVIKTVRDKNPDGHWIMYYLACCPCHYDYGYITKVETLSEDLEYVFHKLGIPSDPNESFNQHRKNVEEAYEDLKYYKNVTLWIRRTIYSYYKYDIDMFGYQVPQWILEE